MVISGPIMLWFWFLGGDPENTLVFVGDQAEGTLGHQIQQGRDEISINDTSGVQVDRVALLMGDETVDGFSGHADRQRLENFVRTMNPRPEQVLCVHGEEASTNQLSSGLYQDLRMRIVATAESQDVQDGLTPWDHSEIGHHR